VKLLDKYIAKTVLAAILLVTVLLFGLQLFILFVNQLPDLGKADYDLFAALHYVILDMPYEVYLFFPMASLLGCLIALGTMANNHELVVMRAAGMSIGQITFAVLKIAILIILFVTVLGESVLPNWVRDAHQYKTQALTGGQSIATSHGFWVRYRDDFIKIGTVGNDHNLQDILQFHFDDQHNLVFSRHIDELRAVKNSSWVAKGVMETWIYAHGTQQKSYSSMPWEVPLVWSVLGISQRQIDEMTLYELHNSLQAQKNNHLSGNNERLIYLQRLMQPFTTLVMMLLAIPFIFGPLRSATMGSRLLAGAAMGFGFYIVNRFLGSASQVYQWSSFAAAIAPTLICAGFGCWLMWRTV
jgi:lipopolysaccharide export system permease protein